MNEACLGYVKLRDQVVSTEARLLRRRVILMAFLIGIDERRVTCRGSKPEYLGIARGVNSDNLSSGRVAVVLHSQLIGGAGRNSLLHLGCQPNS